MQYRKEIDGLRAVAILPVVAYHLLILRGGFIGVDIFFVISGYLISSIVFEDLRQNRFSLYRFYERRIRRIGPALFVMLTATLLVSVLTLAPAEAVRVAESAVAAVASFSNVYFWQHSGYFENPASTMPLLHTWSLGVEEQFYLVFPPMVWAWNRWRPGKLLELVLPVLVLSLWLSERGAARHEESAFYLLHGRAFELMLGSIAALNLVDLSGPRLLRECMAALGLLAIAVPLILYNDDWPFPGFAALVPCLGTLLVIEATRLPTLVGNLLSLEPLTFVGRISYSLYLWHWPVIIFQRADWLFYTGDSRLIEKLILIALSFALAILSWKFIETPFRSSAWVRPGQGVFSLFLLSVGAILSFAAVVISTNGLPGLGSGQRAHYTSILAYDPGPEFRLGQCMIDETSSISPDCLNVRTDRPNMVLLGDSHAAQLWTGLNTVFPDINILQLTGSSCLPTAGALASAYPTCKTLMGEVLPRILREHRIDIVVLAGHWVRTGGEGATAIAASLRAKGVPVLLVGPVPNYTRPLPRLLQLGLRTGDPQTPDRFLDDETFSVDRMLSEETRKAGIPYVSPVALMCTGKSCKTLLNGEPIQFDSNHLTASGSTYLASLLRNSGVLQSLMRSRGVPSTR